MQRALRSNSGLLDLLVSFITLRSSALFILSRPAITQVIAPQFAPWKEGTFSLTANIEVSFQGFMIFPDFSR